MFKLFALLLVLTPSVVPALTVKLNEDVLAQMVKERNGRVLGAQVGIQAAQSELGYLKRSFLPNIELDLGYENTDGSPRSSINNSYGYGGASASVNLFNGGKDSLRERALRANLLKANTELLGSNFDILTLARTLYWKMIFQKEVINVLESALKMNEKNLAAALKKIRNNLATSTDSIDFNQTKIQYGQDLKKAKILLINNMRQMAAILHQPADTIYEVPELIAHTPDHAIDKFSGKFLADKHREVLSLEAIQQATDAESAIKSRWWTPSLDVYGAKEMRFKKLDNPLEIDRDEGEVLGVKLTFFFDGFQSQASSVAESYRAKAVSLIKHQRSHEIETAYSNSYELYELNHDLVHSAEENNKLAERYYENVWGEYTRGIKNSPDVLQAFQRVVESKLRYAEIKRDYQIARAEILGFIQE